MGYTFFIGENDEVNLNKKTKSRCMCKIFLDFEKGIKNVIISIEKLHKLIDKR